MTEETENRALIVRGRYDLTVPERALFKRGILLAQSREASIFFIEGVIYEIYGKRDDALNSYKKGVELYPKCAAAYYKMGRIHRLKREFDQAISNFTSVIGIEPENFFAYYYRGSSFFSKEQNDQAIFDFDKALTIVPIMKDGFAYEWIFKLNNALLNKWFSSFVTIREEKILRLRLGIGEAFVYDNKRTFLNIYTSIGRQIYDSEMKRYIYNLYYLLSLAHSRKKEYEKAIRYINPTTIHRMKPPTQPAFVSDERDKRDDSSSVSMRQGQ